MINLIVTVRVWVSHSESIGQTYELYCKKFVIISYKLLCYRNSDENNRRLENEMNSLKAEIKEVRSKRDEYQLAKVVRAKSSKNRWILNLGTSWITR